MTGPAPTPHQKAEATRSASVLAAIRAEPAGMTRGAIAARFSAGQCPGWALAYLARRGLVLPCWRHRGSESGPPELVYHALYPRSRS